MRTGLVVLGQHDTKGRFSRLGMGTKGNFSLVELDIAVGVGVIICKNPLCFSEIRSYFLSPSSDRCPLPQIVLSLPFSKIIYRPTSVYSGRYSRRCDTSVWYLARYPCRRNKFYTF